MQTSYDYNMQPAVAGGLRDTSPHSIVSRANGETTWGAVKSGMGVVRGYNPGEDVKLPVTASTVDLFEGMVKTGILERDLSGEAKIPPKKTLNIIKWGAVWARVEDSLTIEYGDAAYLITSGDSAGLFTNDDSDTSVTYIAVNGVFVGGVKSDNIAPLDLYNQNASGASDTADIAELDTRVTALENA